MDKTRNVDMSRRDVLRSAVVGGAGLAIGAPHIVYGMAKSTSKQKLRNRSLRLAHLTDIHLQPERGAAAGLAALFTHAQALDDAPELFITGGDNIMDSWEADEQRTKLQWDLFNKTVKEHCHQPIKYCIGNHDIWGGDKKKSKTTGNEPLWGTKWFVEMFNLPNSYYSFDNSGWRFIVLNSVAPFERKGGASYIGQLDEEQFNWLSGKLETTASDMPICVVSHIPIVSITAIEFLKPENHKICVAGSHMHYDCPAIIRLFKKYPNVKLCLSGHTHRVDHISYCGTSYVCDGAVSGAWWGGDHDVCDEGYGIIDLYEDGTFDHQYMVYNWVVQK